MSRNTLPLALALSLLAAGPVLAQPPPDQGKGHGHDHDQKGPPPGKAKGHWKNGDMLPPQNRGQYVSDYAKHGLKPPPPGHQWRRVDDDFVLIAVTTGVIASVIAASH